MRTNIEINDELMRKAKEVSGLNTKKEVVEEALRVLIQEKTKPDLRDLRGKFEFADDFDYKELRKGFVHGID